MAELLAEPCADPTASRRPRSRIADPVAEFERFLGIVRRQQHGAALTPADLLAEKRSERARQHRIEPARRLVEQQDLRPRNQRARDQQPLLHPGRELPHQLGARLVKSDGLEQLVRPRSSISRRGTP